ncbi:unnamed protein product [Triticum turgidum subsp. durum]|uniref:Jacalin-type lectin domain-containing protein n=1 Tax=Triticum turgidum subsp. durum TaxID=4567 RepID=A0A9R1Q5S4_TRITD|nr:unnamed protein product [Triticum turgidum subsp. durum]
MEQQHGGSSSDATHSIDVGIDPEAPSAHTSSVPVRGWTSGLLDLPRQPRGQEQMYLLLHHRWLQPVLHPYQLQPLPRRRAHSVVRSCRLPQHRLRVHCREDALPGEGGACPIRAGLQPKVYVIKTAPCGGRDGMDWDMDVRGVNRITKVVVWHRILFAFDAMSVLYERDGREEHTEEWGEPCGERSEICLELDEYLIGVKGHLWNISDRLSVKSLTFISNRRTYGPYGKEAGAPFELPALGGRIVGFHGRSDSYLNALGTYIKMDA